MSRTKYDILFFKNLASNKKGECISDNYINANSKLTWECEKGHTWNAIPNSILRGTWCPDCANKRKKTIKDMQLLASLKGGECLSKEYINGKSQLKWKCVNNHIWNARYDNIFQGKWCPDCSTGLSERICRTYFEEVFKVQFPNTRGLDWLKSPNGFFLELDGYNAKLKLAFEHQGEQHYSDSSYFETSNYDTIKSDLCKQNDILLIAIPQLGIRLKHKDFHLFLKKKLLNTRFEKTHLPSLDSIDLKRAYTHSFVFEMNELAKRKGIKFLSKNYLGSSTHHNWECLEGHRWKTTPSSIKSGTGCPKCAQNRNSEKLRTDIKEVRKFITVKGGVLLSENYVNQSEKIKIQCEKGHIWKARFNALKKGHWCPFCAGQGKLTLEDMKLIAKEKNGKCLSKNYINANKKLIWECEEGHTWEATGGAIKNGSWCLKCSGFSKLTIDEFQAIAIKLNGKCISREYKNANSKLEFQCSEGHIWSSRANHIKRGSWCPICKRKTSAQKRGLGISTMQILAKKFNGKCLSITYKNSKSELEWECEKGHTFFKKPDYVKKGRWCQECKD